MGAGTRLPHRPAGRRRPVAEPIGEIGGPFADSTRRAFALHILDELIHHGAEVALLRDLYRAWPG